MKKLFFAICINICLFGVSYSKITPISGYSNIKQEIIGNKEDAVKEINLEEMSEFLSERLKNAQKVKAEDINRNMAVIESDIERHQRKEREKNFFQKVYEKTIRKIKTPSDKIREDVVEETKDVSKEEFVTEIEEQKNKWNDLSIPTIPVLLPDSNIPVDVPAIEHIPYLKNNIEILPNGMVKFEEVIVVVANGQKLKSGLTKILPSKIFNKQQKPQNIDYSIISVTVNDNPVNYKLAKSGERVLFVPEKEDTLPAGVYIYKFEYLADNVLLDDENVYNFYWNIGGNGLNLVIDRTFVKLTTPNKQATVQNEAVIGSANGFYSNSVTATQDGISYLYEAQIPVFIGTGMHLTVDIDKKAFYSTTFFQKVIRSFYDYGDIYISFMGLCIIAASFAISWSYIINGKSRVKVALNKTSSVIRYILNEQIDKKTICGFLLDLYKKNIIDIQQSGETILLIKSTDNLKSLCGYEKKALKCIFPSHETTFSVTKANQLPLKRFAQKMEKGLKRDIFKFKVKLNSGYLLLSLAIMSVIWIGMASFKIDSLYTFNVIAVNTLLCALGAIIWYMGNKKWQKIVAKYFSVNIMSFCWVIYSAVVNPLASLFLIWNVVLVVYSLKLYSSRNGLLRSYVQDIIKQKEHLLKNKDTISLGRGFLKYQAFIFVCDIENEIKPLQEDEKYKITIIKNIMKRL